MSARTFGRVRPVAVGLAVVVILAGCAGGAVAPPDVGAPVDGGTRGSAVGGAQTGVFPEVVPPGYEGPLAAPSAAPDEFGGGDGTALRDDAKIIKTGTLSLEVDKLDTTLKKARAAIVDLGGYVAGSDESNDGDRTQATIVYRIPAERWDDALDALRGLAVKVVGEQTNAVEVTGQVLDLDARIKNLRATEASLQAIMVKAIKISDVLEVQRELTIVREQIEQLSTEKAHLEDQAALGTLSVYFTVPVPAVTETAQGWDPAAEVDRAIASLMGVLQGAVSLGIWLVIMGLPILLAIGLIVLALAFVVRRLGLGRRPGAGPLPPVVPPVAPAAPGA